MNQLYRGAFNFHRQAIIEYSWASSQRQAWLRMCRRIAKKDGVSAGTVMSLFDGSKNNYEITIEMEVKEVDAPMAENQKSMV